MFLPDFPYYRGRRHGAQPLNNSKFCLVVPARRAIVDALVSNDGQVCGLVCVCVGGHGGTGELKPKRVRSSGIYISIYIGN